jgi:PAS domain S-box-containing protein
MNSNKLKILLLEDSIQDMELICELLTNAGYHIDLTHVDNALSYTAALQGSVYDIILSDFSLKGYDAFGSLEISKQICPETPFICISGSIGEETAIELLKNGAVDYVLKDRPDRLPFSIQRALDEASIRRSHLKASNALQESELKFRNIFQNHAAVKLIIDPETGSIVEANHAAVNFYGWPAEVLQTKSIFEINLTHKEVLKKEILRAQESSKVQFEFKHQKADGTIVDVEVFSSTITIRGKRYLHSIIHDVSEKKRISEDLLKAKEKAIESDRLKTAFINNISHEIRTPLNSILGFGQFLAESDLSKEERLDTYKHIQKSSDRLMKTVLDYMDMAMLVSSSMKPYKTKFNLQAFFLDVVNQYKTISEEKDLEFNIEIPQNSEQIMVFSDAEFLQKIIEKILDNAVKFTKKGTISCGYSITPSSIEFFIQDSGKGIAPDKLDLIFHMFSQEELSMSRGYEGSGLGLTIAKGMLALLGGVICVDSQPGSGSTFYFRIPFDETQKLPLDNNCSSSFGSLIDEPLILIAEDDELNYKYLETLLTINKFKFIHAINGAEAVDYCRNNSRISLVLMDIKMPIINGIEATQLIREFRPHLPIVATTAYAQTGDEHKFITVGCNDYLVKPIKKDQLIKMIEKYS